MTQLSDKVALITGVSSGLGAVVAQVFAERGAKVFGIARRADEMATVFETVPGGKYASVDISSPEACRGAVAQTVEEFGRLDVLVNVAGFHQMRHTTTMTDEEWNLDLAVNLNGPFYLCRAALPHLLETGGNIVNVTSIAGVEGEVYSAGYCAAKHGLVGLTRALAGRHADAAGDGVHRPRERRLGSDHADRLPARFHGTFRRREGDRVPRQRRRRRHPRCGVSDRQRKRRRLNRRLYAS
jgi:NAD(P)-dependent dehydrogenase (short-subunit alcohol dehydrogenase family)